MKKGRKPQAKINLPSGWWGRLFEFCRAKWQLHAEIDEAFDIYDFIKISRRTFSTARRTDQFTEKMFLVLVQQVGCKNQDELLKVLCPPAVANISSSPQAPSEQKTTYTIEEIDQKLLTDPLVGVSVADRRTQPEWNFAFEKAEQRLKENPEDTFLRAMLVWSTLLKGDPDQILKVVQDTANWLQSDQAGDFPGKIELWLKRKELWQNRIAGISDKSIEDSDCVRVVLEDTLVREALLRWLKADGRFSPLAERIRTIKTRGLSNDVKTIFENARHQHVENWVSGAIDDAYNWISAVHSLGLPHVFLLWLTGRDLKSRNQIPSVIQLALNWLDNHKNINDSLVRWGSIWLAGMLGSNQYTVSLIQRTSKWLNASASKDDRLVRWAYLWFVGEQGNQKHLKSAIEETAVWFNNSHNHNDTCIRLALLFCVRRATERGMGTDSQLYKVIDDMRPLMKDDQLIELAVNLTSCQLPATHRPGKLNL